MKRLFCIIVSFTLTIQPLFAQQAQPNQTVNQPTPKQTKPTIEPQAQQIAIEELLPADTIAYLATSNLSGLVENYRQLDAVKVLEARVLKIGSKDNENPVTEALKYLSFGLEDSPALSGTRVGFAALKPEKPVNDGQPLPLPPPSSRSLEIIEVKKVESHELVTGTNPQISTIGETTDGGSAKPLFLSFVESPNPEAATKVREQFITFFSKNFEPLGELSEIKQTTRQGVTIDRFNNGYIGTFIGTTYLIGEVAAIDKIVEVHKSRDAARLSDKADFARARSQMASPAGVFAYLNSEPLVQMISPSLGEVIPAIAGLGFLLSDIKALSSVAFSSTFDRQGVVDRLAFNFNQSDPTLLKTIFSGPQIEMKSLSMIPSGTAVVATHSVDWPVVYDNLIVPVVFKSMAQYQAMREVYAEMAKERQERGQQSNEQPTVPADGANDNEPENDENQLPSPPPPPPPAPQISEQDMERLRQGPDPQKLEEAAQALVAQYEK
ncbi:MAG TPA: hypothetical protein VEF04_06335, partial [Blastocatellia bacterium]|nr:hypothetical protein [Blastocatellia bacterium]